MIDSLQFDRPQHLEDFATLRTSDWNRISGKLFGDFLANCRDRDIRTMAQFVEDEIVVPTGPYAGQRYSLDTQPYARLWFNEIDSGRWYEHCGTGPSQSGKSLSFFVAPIIYHLFERGEKVIMATTTDDMFRDKFNEDILPVIEKTRYKKLLGRVGKNASEVYFSNGGVLKNMTCGGDDKARSHYTGSALAMTEVDGMSEGHSTSSESHPIAQLEARLRSEQRSQRSVYKECTVTFEDGYIWDSIHNRGSGGRIFGECRHCLEYVRPDRPHLIGWEDAADEIDAENNSAFHCYKCGHAWTEDDRLHFNLSAKLVHKGQTITKGGIIHGELPRTRTLGFRYSAVNNLLLPATDIGVDEFHAKRSDEEIAEEKRMTQFVWALPFVMPGEETIKLDKKELNNRRFETTKGVCPNEVKYLTIGCDCGLYDVHWVAIAWIISPAQRYGVVVDYGRIHLQIENPHYDPDIVKSKRFLTANDLSFEEVWNANMDKWRDEVVLRGFAIQGNTIGERMYPDQVWMDARYQGRDGSDIKPIYMWMREQNKKLKGLFRPLLGFGTQQYRKQHRRYNAPKKTSKTVLKIGQHYHIEWNEDQAMREVHHDSNAWLEVSHSRLNKPKDHDGALLMYESSNPTEHNKFMSHIVATVKKKHFEPGKGWEEEESPKRQDHYGDALGYGSAAGHFSGFRIHPSRKAPRSKQKKKQYDQPAQITKHSGQRF